MSVRTPSFVKSVEDAGQPSLIRSCSQKPVQAASQLQRRDFSCIRRADRRHMRGIEDAGLEKRQLAVELHAIDLERAGWDSEGG